MLKKYLDYIKDNPDGYWFKRKLFGWGWTPATWQGWLVTLAFIAFVFFEAFQLEKYGENIGFEEIKWFYMKLVLAILIFFIIAYKTGEKPKWQWGPKQKDDKENQ